MKRGARLFFTALMVPAAGVFLLGCPKKISTTDTTPQPKVNELVSATHPAPGGDSAGASAGAAGRATPESQFEEQRVAQLLASRGEDIPIREAPSVEFVDPTDENREILKPVYFDYDKASIRPEYQPVLENISKWLAKNDRQLLIEGHCDERGTDEYNLALGERRALAVRRYLIALGSTSDRLHTISYGEEKPAVSGSTEEAWAKNRRVEFKVSAE